MKVRKEVVFFKIIILRYVQVRVFQLYIAKNKHFEPLIPVCFLLNKNRHRNRTEYVTDT